MGSVCCPPPASNAKPKVLVLGESGTLLGRRTVESLLERHGDDVDVYATVENAPAGDVPSVLAGVWDLDLTQSSPAVLQEILQGMDRVFLVTPIDRAAVCLAALDACRDAGVQWVVLLSVWGAQSTDSGVFGREFYPVEQHLMRHGGPMGYTILRTPLFIDVHVVIHASSIRQSSVWYDPRNPHKRCTPVVAVQDVAQAAADILAAPGRHGGQVYHLVMPPFSLSELAAALSRALYKLVRVKKISHAQAHRTLLAKGFSPLGAKGIIDLYRLMDRDSPLTTKESSRLGDFETITGQAPTTMEEWVEAHAHLFRS